MLSLEGVLDAVDVKIDYIGASASIAEHGYNLLAVNRYELCAQKTLEQSEWWPMTHCMFELQDCLNYNSTLEAGNQTCGGAAEGVDDDLALAGDDSPTSATGASLCTCTLTGVVSYCAERHTSTNGAALTACAASARVHAWAQTSKAVADNANAGLPYWLDLNGKNYTHPASMPGYSDAELVSWVETVLEASCDAIIAAAGSDDDAVPAGCVSVSPTRLAATARADAVRTSPPRYHAQCS